MHPTLADMAAAYMFHIIKNHPFIDGNKRTGTACAWIFLSINSANPQGSAQILENTALGVAESLISKKELGQIFQCFVLSNA
jgi:death-on-curing protein